MENAWALRERQRLLDSGQNKTPKMTREEIISLVQCAWLSIDHGRLAEKAYRQTGPTMPLRGPVSPDDVFHDLCKVMIELDDSSTPDELGMKLRDDAVAFVKEGKETGKWSTWADAHLLIDDQDGPEEALAEGLEAFGAAAGDTDDEKTESLDEDDEDDAAAEWWLSAKRSYWPPAKCRRACSCRRA